jgi:hypothetical protein
MVYDGQFILTESEPVFDGADTLRFGRDMFVTLSHVRIYVNVLQCKGFFSIWITTMSVVGILVLIKS